MARAYSMDLRERVVALVERDGLSRHEAAARFGVAASSAIKWVRRFRETGSVAPGQIGGHNPIEQMFAKLKHLLRKAAERTAEAAVWSQHVMV